MFPLEGGDATLTGQSQKIAKIQLPHHANGTKRYSLLSPPCMTPELCFRSLRGSLCIEFCRLRVLATCCARKSDSSRCSSCTCSWNWVLIGSGALANRKVLSAATQREKGSVPSELSALISSGSSTMILDSLSVRCSNLGSGGRSLSFCRGDPFSMSSSAWGSMITQSGNC